MLRTALQEKLKASTDVESSSCDDFHPESDSIVALMYSSNSLRVVFICMSQDIWPACSVDRAHAWMDVGKCIGWPFGDVEQLKLLNIGDVLSTDPPQNYWYSMEIGLRLKHRQSGLRNWSTRFLVFFHIRHIENRLEHAKL